MSSRSNRHQRRRKENEVVDSQAKTSKSDYGGQIQRLQPKTLNQARLIRSIKQNHVTVAAAPAGCGKTLIALHEAVWMLDKGLIDQILYVKPIVDITDQRGLGFLPGDLDEKVLPLLAPLLDNLEVFVAPGKIQYLLAKETIKFQPLEYIRGRSLRNTFIVADEFQNATIHNALTVISRIEESSRIVMLGDPRQRDNRLTTNALTDAMARLKGATSVGVVQFEKEDIVRNVFLKDVFDRYDS
jgi:phosphate starvation-inducible PhoH-like protein